MINEKITKVIDGTVSNIIVSLSAAKYIGKKVIENPQIKPTINETVSIAKEAGEIAKFGVKLGVVGVAATQLSPAFALAFLPEAIDLVTGVAEKELKDTKNERTENKTVENNA